MNAEVAVSLQALGRKGNWTPPISQAVWPALMETNSAVAIGVYWMLASRVKKGENTCWASQAELCRELGKDERIVRRGTKALERVGLVKRTRMAYRGTSMTYEIVGLVWDRKADVKVPLSTGKADTNGRKADFKGPKGGQIRHKKGGPISPPVQSQRVHPQGESRWDTPSSLSAPLGGPPSDGGKKHDARVTLSDKVSRQTALSHPAPSPSSGNNGTAPTDSYPPPPPHTRRIVPNSPFYALAEKVSREIGADVNLWCEDDYTAAISHPTDGAADCLIVKMIRTDTDDDGKEIKEPRCYIQNEEGESTPYTAKRRDYIRQALGLDGVHHD